MINRDTYIKENMPLLLQTIRELCAIPAPSNNEYERAAYCKQWLENVGAKGVYIDEALNTVFPLNCDNANAITVFVAHTDTVFPDTTPLPYIEDETTIQCPGVGDNTASVAVLLLLVKYFVTYNITPANGFLFVLNSGEEGLGNLKGTRKIFEDYGDRIADFISFDGYMDAISDRCAGSHRYEVTVKTEGGHSFQRFGNANAINELAKIITALEGIAIPEKENARTTYNVGTIIGGTSVNTIAQEASMLCEYRSTNWECLGYMQQQFQRIFTEARSDYVDVEVVMVGERPCARIDKAKEETLRDGILPVLEKIMDSPVKCKSASTDCNIPLSLGIPAVCIGVCRGGGAHTREEWVDKSSLSLGMKIAIATATYLMDRKS